LGISISGINPLTTTLTAALPDTGVSTDSQDKAIDQLMATMSAAKISITSTGATTSGNSTNFSQLMFSSGTTSTAVSSAITSLVTTQNNSGNVISTSSLTGCPYAKSGKYVTYDVGGVKTSFGLVMINFGSSALSFKPNSSTTISIPANTMRVPNKTGATGTTDLTIISPTTSTPCKFRGQVNGTSVVEFSVSRAGFIVGTPFFMPDVTGTTIDVTLYGLNQDNFIGIGIPVQSNISLSDLTGNWNLAGWGQKTSGSAYTNIFEKAVLTFANNTLSGSSFFCDNGITDVCTSSSTFTVTKCTTCTDLGGNLINNIFTVTGTNNTSLKVAGFRASNGDLIAMAIGGDANAGSGSFFRYFSMISKTATAATIPKNGTIVTRPSWQLSSNNSGLNTLKLVNNRYTMSNATSNSTRETITASSTSSEIGCFREYFYDNPRIGMRTRLSNTNQCYNTPTTGIRGNGFSIGGGTALVSTYPTIGTGLARFYGISLEY